MPRPIRALLGLLALGTASAQGTVTRLGEHTLKGDAQPLLLSRDGAVAVVERGAGGATVTSFDGEQRKLLAPLDVRGQVLAGNERRLLVLDGARLKVVGAVTGDDLVSWAAPAGSTAASLRVTGDDTWWLVRSGRAAHLVRQRTYQRQMFTLPDCPTCTARLVGDGRGGVLVALDEPSGPNARHWLVSPRTGAQARLPQAAVAVVDNLLFQAGPDPTSPDLPTTVVRATDTAGFPNLFVGAARRRWGVPPAFRATSAPGTRLALEGVLWNDATKFYLFSGNPSLPLYNASAQQWQSLATEVRLFRLVDDLTVLNRVMGRGGSGLARYTQTPRYLLEALGDRLNVYARPAYTLRLSMTLPYARTYTFADLPDGLLLATLQENGVVRLGGGKVTFSKLTW